jgi:hypothetical protein
MSGAINGTTSDQISLADLLPVGPSRLTSFNIPVIVGILQTWTPGTGPKQANLLFEASGTASAAPVDTDLTTAVCVDGTAGMGHVRFYCVLNIDPTNVLTIGLPAGLSNGFAPELAGTNPTITIQPGECKSFSIPLAANGWTVDPTHKVIRIDPGANNVLYELVVLGY